MGIGKSKICRAGQQSGDPGKSWCCSSRSKAVQRQNSLFLRGPQSFSLEVFNWLDEAHPHFVQSSALLKIYQYKGSSHLKIAPQQYPDWCLTKYLGTLPKPSWHKINHHHIHQTPQSLKQKKIRNYPKPWNPLQLSFRENAQNGTLSPQGSGPQLWGRGEHSSKCPGSPSATLPLL